MTGVQTCALPISYCLFPLPYAYCAPARTSQGTLTPLLGIGVCVSIQFGALEYSKRLFAAQNVRSGRGGPDGAALGSGQLFVSGVFAGLANGVVSGPVEHIRIREHFSVLPAPISAPSHTTAPAPATPVSTSRARRASIPRPPRPARVSTAERSQL